MRACTARAPRRRPVAGRRTAPARPGAAIAARSVSQACSACDRLAPDRHDARLRALAEDAHRAIAEVDVGDVEADQFGQAQPRANTTAPSSRGRVAPAGRRPAATSSRAMWSTSSVFGRRFAGLRRADVVGRVGLHQSLADQEVEEAAQRRQPALDAARAESVAMLMGREAAHVEVVDAASRRRSRCARSTASNAVRSRR